VRGEDRTRSRPPTEHQGFRVRWIQPRIGRPPRTSITAPLQACGSKPAQLRQASYKSSALTPPPACLHRRQLHTQPHRTGVRLWTSFPGLRRPCASRLLRCPNEMREKQTFERLLAWSRERRVRLCRSPTQGTEHDTLDLSWRLRSDCPRQSPPPTCNPLNAAGGANRTPERRTRSLGACFTY